MANFCSSCGGKIEFQNGASACFCGNCGAAILRVNPQTAPSQSVSTQGVTVSETVLDKSALHKPTSKKTKVIIAAMGGAAAVVVLTFALMAFILPSFMPSPYQRAEMRFFNSMINQFNDFTGGVQYDVSLSYFPSNDVRDLFNGDFDDFNINALISVLGEQLLVESTMTSGRDSLSAVFTVDNSEVTFALPEITRYFIRYATDPESFETSTELNQRQLNRTLRAIATEYFRLADSIAHIETGVTVGNENITLTANQHTMIFHESDIMELLLFSLREVRTNRNLMDWMDDTFLRGFGEIYDYLDDFIFNLQDELDRLRGNQVLFRMTVWINGGTIVQRRLDRFMDSDLVINHQHLVTRNAATFGLTLRTPDLRIGISADFERRSGSWEGYGSAFINNRNWRDNTWDEHSILFQVDDFRFGRHAMEGTVNFSFTQENWRGSQNGFNFTLALSREGRAQIIELTGRVIEDGERFDIGFLRISYSETSIRRIEMPNRNERYAITINGDDSAWRSMYNDIDQTRLELRGSMFSNILQELQWTMRYNWFWIPPPNNL